MSFYWGFNSLSTFLFKGVMIVELRPSLRLGGCLFYYKLLS